MNLCYTLLADIPIYQQVSDSQRRMRGRMDLLDLWPIALMLIVAAGIIALAVLIRKRNDMSQTCNDPNKLFRELSLGHGLDRASQKLLRQLAQALQLAQPAEIFLQPAYFHAERIPPELRGEEARLDALHRRLF